jgi:hypothetical protein
MGIQKCRICGCTDDDCRGCIEKTGEPCYWVEYDLCSACAGALPVSKIQELLSPKIVKAFRKIVAQDIPKSGKAENVTGNDNRRP